MTSRKKTRRYALFIASCLFMSLFFLITLNFMNPLKDNNKIEYNKNERVENTHPNIILKNHDFKKIHSEIQTDYNVNRWYKKLQIETNTIMNMPVGNSSRLKNDSFREITELSLMYKITHERKYAIRAWKELKIISMTDWNTKHFLDTVDFIEAVSIGYDWLYDYWSPQQRKVLINALVEKGLIPALEVYRGFVKDKNITTFWAKTNNNWNSVCNSGVGVGALAIKDEYPNLSKEILNFAVRSIKKSLKVYSPDGGMPEGPSYWNYSTLNIALFLSSLDTTKGTDFGLSQEKGFSDTGYYPIYMSSGVFSFNVGDSGSTVESSSPQMLWFAKKYNNAIFFSFGSRSNDPLSLIWYDPEQNKPQKRNISIPLDRLFINPNTGIVTMRSSWSSNSLFAGFHWGNNNVNHGDLDMGDFVLDYDNIRWVNDLGGDSYNLNGYFNMANDRWLYYRKRAEGQNTLVINPSSDPDQNVYGKGKILSYSSNKKQARAVVDMTDAYYKYALSIKRSLTLIRNKNIIILQDKIMLKRPYDLYWFMHTYTNIELSPDNRTAILSQKNKKMLVHIVSSNDSTFKIMKAIPLSTSPSPSYQGQNNNVRKLSIHLNHVQNTTITVFFKPVK